MMTNNRHTQFVHPSLGLAEQPPKRGAVNVASAQLETAGTADSSFRLLEEFFQGLRRHAVPEIRELDEIDPANLASRLQGRIATLADFTEPSSDRESLRQLEHSLKQQQASRSGKLGREINSASEEVLDEVFRPLQVSVEAAFDSAPFAVPQVIAQVKATLESLDLPEPNVAPFATFYRIVRGINEISNLSGSLPRKSVEFAMEQLFTRALPTFDEALAALARTQMTSALKQRMVQFSELLAETEQRFITFRGNVESIVSAAEEARTQAHEQLEAARSSTVHALPGPTEDNVVAGIQAKFRCDDRQELLAAIGSKWEVRLRAYAKEHHSWIPQSCALAELLTHLAPLESAAEFVQLITDSVGDGHTLYDSVVVNGTEQLASELFERAAPLCNLASRDIAQFNIHPTDCTIIRLPRTKGHKDGEIRRQLVEAFSRLGSCSFVEASDLERDAIVVVRARIGFPIGIEESNHTMLMHYAKSVSSGHLPHLLGLTSSELGEPVADYVNLSLKFQNQENTNDG